jgi:hypothetical protein
VCKCVCVCVSVCVCAHVCKCVCVCLRVGGGRGSDHRTRCPAGSPWQAGQAITPATLLRPLRIQTEIAADNLEEKHKHTQTHTQTQTHTHRHTTLIRNRSKPLQPGPLQQQGPLQPGPRQPGARFKHGYGCRVTTCETSRGRCSRKHTHPEPLLPGPLQPGPLQSGKRFEHGCACRMTACETSRGHCGRGFQSLVWVATKLEI